MAKLEADEVLNNLKKITSPSVFYDAAEASMEKACLRIVADAKRKCPVQTGTLRNSIDYAVEEEDGNLAGYVGSNLEYAPFVHQGTGIYAIEGMAAKKSPGLIILKKTANFILLLV